MATWRCFGHLENPEKDRCTDRISKSTAKHRLAQGTHRQVGFRTIQAEDPSTVGKRKLPIVPAYIPIELEPIIDKALQVRWEPPKNAPQRITPAVMNLEDWMRSNEATGTAPAP